MKTKNASPVRQLVPAALFLALAFVLPLLTGQVPKVGNMLCPMHFPVLLCGFVLGGPWGLAVGFAAPLLRSVLFGMPPMFPVAISMAFELATYGLVSGLLWRRAKHNLPALYAVLLTAMVSGRIVWGIVRFVLAGLTGGSFPFSAFFVRGTVYRRAGHRGAAGAHPAAAHRPAKGRFCGLTPCAHPLCKKTILPPVFKALFPKETENRKNCAVLWLSVGKCDKLGLDAGVYRCAPPTRSK